MSLRKIYLQRECRDQAAHGLRFSQYPSAHAKFPQTKLIGGSKLIKKKILDARSLRSIYLSPAERLDVSHTLIGLLHTLRARPNGDFAHHQHFKPFRP